LFIRCVHAEIQTGKGAGSEAHRIAWLSENHDVGGFATAGANDGESNFTLNLTIDGDHRLPPLCCYT